MVPTVLNSYVTQQDSGRSELYFEVLTCHIFATSIKHIFQYTIYIYIPFIDFSHGNSENPPVFRCFSHWKFAKMVDFPACHVNCIAFCGAAGLYWSLPCIRRFIECNISGDSLSIIEWFVQLAYLALRLNDVQKAYFMSQQFGQTCLGKSKLYSKDYWNDYFCTHISAHVV